MNMEIILLDGTSIYPSYAHEHKDSVIEFYKARLDEGLITGWAII
jgi:hypothetical protein